MPDLNTIPGFTALQALTLGDPRIKIAVLDGPADLDRACFKGANLSRVKPYWQEPLEPIDPFYIQQELKIRALSDQKKALKKARKAQEQQVQGSVEASGAASAISVMPSLPVAEALQLSTALTVFGAPLESSEASLLAQYHRLKQVTVLERSQPVPEQAIAPPIDYTAAIEALEAEIKALEETIPAPVKERLGGIFHATGIFGTMFGQPGSPVEGVVPYCTAINIPLFETPTSNTALSPLHLAHAFNLALDLGVNIIHCAACHPTQTGFAHEMIQRAVKQCQDNNILIVAPSGNNKGEWSCAPAILPNVLAVGMMKDNGQPANYSNWGGQYQRQGILAPGENMIAAQPGTDEPARQEGTSLAAPLMTGLSALMMSLQLQRGEQPNAEAVRQAFLQSAIPCDPEVVAEPDRCMVGQLNIPGAFQRLTGETLRGAIAPSVIESVAGIGESNNNIIAATPALPVAASAAPAENVAPSIVSGLVYALGTIGYDFGSDARRDTFKQRMVAVNVDGVLAPANPYDTRQMVEYLLQRPAEGKSLIWTLNQELTPIYALEPKGGYADEIYAAFQLLLDGQSIPTDHPNYLERVSIPGRLTDRTVELLSGEVVPVIILPNVRGIYGWQANTLVDFAVRQIQDLQGEIDEARIRRSLKNFLQRVYYELKNLGQLDRDRTLNFAATNAFQAASTFAEAIAAGMELRTIEIEKSPFCRLHSNCWDVKLTFFDSENSRRANKVYRFTIDVKDMLPVTLGSVRSWSIPKNNSSKS